jgi:pimeloyl-ACP methyl ester carboxylesterase
VPAALNTAACVDWPAVDPDRYLGPWNAPLHAPALVINAREDPDTPLANARATAAELSAARVLVVDGFGHTTLDLPSRCAEDAAAAYLLDPSRAPADGTVCPPDPGAVAFAG